MPVAAHGMIGANMKRRTPGRKKGIRTNAAGRELLKAVRQAATLGRGLQDLLDLRGAERL